MGVDGACYEVTKHPELVGVMGVPPSGQKKPREDLLQDPHKPGTSNNPGMHSPSHDALFTDLQWDNEEDKKEIKREDQG